MAIVKQQFTITYEREVDTETGEILDTRIVNTSDVSRKPSKEKVNKDEDSSPKLYLEDNKCQLNNAAINLIGANVGDKLDIKYDEREHGVIPVIGTEESFGVKGGCKLTKSNTIACRGSKNSELAKYGTEFDIVAHPTKPGIFILTSGDVPFEEIVKDENISTDDVDLDLEGLVDGPVDVIDSSFFKL